ncbi:hypothetical protein ACTXT7_008354 [Hymenolepis weldensis]
MLCRYLNTNHVKRLRNSRVYASTVPAKRLNTNILQAERNLDNEINNKKLMDFGRKVLGKTLFKRLMKYTFYGHFVAGEDVKEIQSLVQRYRQYGVKSILDYSVEKDIPESEAVKKLEKVFHKVIEVPDASTKGINKQYQPSIIFADRQKDVVSARTYYYESEAQCDENMKILMGCIDASASGIATEGFTAIKLTALGRPQFLLQFSDFLIRMERFFNLLTETNKSAHHNSQSVAFIDLESFQKRLEVMGVEISCDKSTNYFTILDRSSNGTIDLLDWMHLKQFEHDFAELFRVRNKETGRTEQLVSTLTEQGVEEMRNMVQRIDHLAQYAKSKGVRLMIDAEHSYFQPAIRRISMEMMRRFNKEYSIVFNTYQCYLKNALKELRQDLLMAEKNDFYFGAKLVRGAYIKQERRRALTLGYPDPTNPTYDATTLMYEDCLEESLLAMDNRPRGRVSIMVATHNEDSVRMKEHGIEPEHRLVCFGQLLGMCDHVSFPLGNAGYSVYKYVPYGPVEEVLPYLSRRAHENQSILSNVSVERQMRWEELKRRVFAGWFFTKPRSS